MAKLAARGLLPSRAFEKASHLGGQSARIPTSWSHRSKREAAVPVLVIVRVLSPRGGLEWPFNAIRRRPSPCGGDAPLWRWGARRCCGRSPRCFLGAFGPVLI